MTTDTGSCSSPRPGPLLPRTTAVAMRGQQAVDGTDEDDRGQREEEQHLQHHAGPDVDGLDDLEGQLVPDRRPDGADPVRELGLRLGHRLEGVPVSLRVRNEPADVVDGELAALAPTVMHQHGDVLAGQRRQRDLALPLPGRIRPVVGVEVVGGHEVAVALGTQDAVDRRLRRLLVIALVREPEVADLLPCDGTDHPVGGHQLGPRPPAAGVADVGVGQRVVGDRMALADLPLG